jgi:hypothetical protein
MAGTWWSTEDVSYLEANYPNGDIAEIARHVGRTEKSVILKAFSSGIARTQEKRNLVRRKHTIDDSFFKTPSPGREYLIGFLAADGNLSSSRKAIGIEIHEHDIAVLEWIKRTLQSTHKISHSNRDDMVYWKLYNPTVYDDLMALGLHPRKSWDFEWPNIDERYIKHFVRGYFDGDGSFYVQRKKLLVAAFCGTNNFIDELKSKLSQNGTAFPSVYRHKNGTTSQMQVCGKKAIAFGDWIYGDGGFRLERKYQIYKQFKLA